MIITRTIASLLFASLLFGIVLISPTNTSSQIGRETPKNSDQNLTGKKAVDELKRSGGYDSLEEAFKKASGMSLSDPEPANLLPGGSYEETLLAGADSAAQDYLGDGVAISGDTVVIGAGSNDHGGFIDPGAAYVFVRAGSTWTEQAKLTAFDRANYDYFGVSVAISGDTIVVGSLYDDAPVSEQGSAYVFTRSGTTWTLQQKLTASDGASGDVFGRTVAISGETILVSSHGDDVGANANQGSAYVFTRSGITWTQRTQLLASDGAANDYFGVGIAISGDTIVVGAYYAQVDGNFFEGAAYVFTGSGASWNQQAKLTADDGAPSDGFGISVAVSGNTAVVGSWYDNVGANADQGSAYVFTRSGATWTQQQKLTASDGAASDGFGTSVAVSGETVVVGAPYDDSGANSNQGSAYRFTYSGSTWTEQQKLTASDGATGDQFGEAVAIDGDTIIVGALGDNVASRTDQGSARIFQTKMTISKVIASDGAQSDWFGYSIAISGNTAVIGAVLDDVGSNTNQGSAYVFTRSGGAWTQQAKLVASDGAQSDWFGFSVAVSGDTAVIGAASSNVGQGSAYVFTRSGGTWTQQQRLVAWDGPAGDYFGYSVAVSGDTAVVGAVLGGGGSDSDQGSAYVFTRSGGTWNQQQKLTASDGAAFDQFGYSVAISGDTVVVGALVDDVFSNADQGSAYVFTRSGGTWTPQQKLVASDGAAFDRFGTSVAISGDTAVVGAYWSDYGSNPDQGSAYVFTRSGTTWTQQQKLVASDGAADDIFGYSVAISGDTAVVGAPYDDFGSNSAQGSAYVFTRSGGTWTQQRKLVASDGAANDQFGLSVAVSGDTAVVGAPIDYVGSNDEQGSAYMYYWGSLRATAGGASLSGRVLETNGRGLANATVVLTDSTGVERTVQTGSFGRFSFSDLPSGETYIVSVRSRRFVVSPQVVNLQSDLSDVRLEASGRSGR